MPKKAKELTATQVRRLTAKPGLHAVGGVSGLLLQVTKSGATSWVLRYSTGEMRPTASGKAYAVRHDMGLGPFPEVTLAQARDAARGAKQQIREGIDPVAERKAARDATRAAQTKRKTFEQVARECHHVKAQDFRSEKHRADWIGSLERYAFEKLGSLPVDAIELPHVKDVLDPIWTSKTETATRVRQRIESVLTFATVSGYREGENPARWDGNLKEVMPNVGKRKRTKHHPALPWQRVPEFMADLHTREGVGARALEFAILTAARSGEVRKATWDEIDLAARVWTIPSERMKAGKPHRVPLSDHAVALLESLPRMEGGYLFAAPRGGVLSDMSISAVCRRMGYTEPTTGRVVVPHGFRSSFKDWARSRTAYPDEVSELALAHVNSDATRAAYARDELLPQRSRLMVDWAGFLDEGPPNTATVATIGQATA
ncbi:integrase arm-type DNA-binding domain-containing protein [Thioalkalivibrio sp. AKL12]|uniref:tyrosine-type recombinase/integrase n=1 Tax=Thioalkalivibrio sp. AKL12 TaxID=1158159 RepID=UPI000366A138|nr:integrase arm-type DNA-binding domain-containing protein [Thioalkalivibrio sp. AKL12]